MKVLITGDRNWNERELIRQELDLLPRDTVIIHGDCRGADSLAGYVAYRLGFRDIRPYPARWYDVEGNFRKWAGPERNQEILDTNPDIELVLAFHHNIQDSKGTKDMINRAKKANVEVKLIG